MAADAEAAAKQRIITHMNNDHSDSVVRFLEFYKTLSTWTATTGVMTDCDTSAMTFTCGGKQYRIPFDPPLKSLRDVRERVVAMDQESRDGLGRSDITVKEFAPPTGPYATSFAVLLVAFAGYSQRWWFADGQVVHRYLGQTFAAINWRIQPWLFAFLAGAHLFETIIFTRTKLAKHSVSPRSIIWWQWVLTTLVEGRFAYSRFDELVQRSREEKAKRSH